MDKGFGQVWVGLAGGRSPPQISDAVVGCPAGLRGVAPLLGSHERRISSLEGAG